MRYGDMLRRCGLLTIMLAALSACETRSISNSGYHAGAANPFYRGELSAYDILGLDRDTPITDQDIKQALVVKQPISIKKGSAIMLVQSGAAFPDPEMVTALERYYTVSSFTGVPLQGSDRFPRDTQPAKVSYSQLFRLAAAKGGFETIVVYWGILESASEGLGTKAISWVPIIGGVIPDQSQHMRIRLMAAIIDVRSGQWETFTTAPLDDDAISNQHSRAASDQSQVALLKAKSYKAAVDELVGRYSQ